MKVRNKASSCLCIVQVWTILFSRPWSWWQLIKALSLEDGMTRFLAEEDSFAKIAVRYSGSWFCMTTYFVPCFSRILDGKRTCRCSSTLRTKFKVPFTEAEKDVCWKLRKVEERVIGDAISAWRGCKSLQESWGASSKAWICHPAER